MLMPATPKETRKSLAPYCLYALGWIGLVSLCNPAYAEPASPLRVHLEQRKLDPSGKALGPGADATQVAPGDLLEYRATYSNHGAHALSVTAVLPIPESLEYAPHSASRGAGLRPQVSQQDKQFAPEPLMKQVLDASGVSKAVAIPYADYRFVQWDIASIAPGASVELRIRAKVSGLTPPEKQSANGGKDGTSLSQ